MKRGSDYAKRIKRLYHELLKKHGKPAPLDPVEPIEQMIIGILALDSSIAKAQAVYKKLRQQTVDLNELRVTPAIELAQMIADGVPLPKPKAQRIVDALNAVRRRQDTLDLDFLRQRGRREARDYLESLDGVGPTVAAHVVLFTLAGHAVPVDNLTLYVLRKEEMVDDDADIPAAQAFLERCISAARSGRVRSIDEPACEHLRLAGAPGKTGRAALSGSAAAAEASAAQSTAASGESPASAREAASAAGRQDAHPGPQDAGSGGQGTRRSDQGPGSGRQSDHPG